MITYSRHKKTFVLRAAAVMVHHGRVLLHHAEKDAFWSLPGGRVAFREEAEQAVQREMREELDADVKVSRLLWVVENFFQQDGRDFHELGLYFLAHLPEDSPLVTLEGPFIRHEKFSGEEPIRLFFQWFAQGDLGKIIILPAFLPSALQSLPDQISHIMNFG